MPTAEQSEQNDEQAYEAAHPHWDFRMYWLVAKAMLEPEVFEHFKTKVDELFSLVLQKFDEKGVVFIYRAFRIAFVAHQFNLNKKAQFRKSGALYMEHPLAEAIMLAQGNWDAITVAGALLHDVPEDSKLGGNLNNRLGWQYNIQEVSGGEDPAAVIQSDVLVAVTDTASDDNDTNLRKSPFQQAQIAFLSEKYAHDHIPHENRHKAYETTRNLNRLFSWALMLPANFRAIPIKQADLWENFDGNMKDEKVLRGRIGINSAYLAGWPEMQTALMERCENSGLRYSRGIRHQRNDDAYYENYTEPPQQFATRYLNDWCHTRGDDAVEMLVAKIIDQFFPGLSRAKVQVNFTWPLLDRQLQSIETSDGINLVPEITLTMPPEAFASAPDQSFRIPRSFPVRVARKIVSPLTATHATAYGEVQRLLGRQNFQFGLYRKSLHGHIVINVISGQPTLKQAITRPHEVPFYQVPEARLFYSLPTLDDTDPTWLDFIQSMVSFCYYEDLPFQRGENPVVPVRWLQKIKTGETLPWITFLSADMTVEEVQELLKIEGFEERAKSTLSQYHPDLCLSPVTRLRSLAPNMKFKTFRSRMVDLTGRADRFVQKTRDGSL